MPLPCSVLCSQGIDTETHYPYTATNGVCSVRHKKHHAVTIDGYEDVPENDEVSLRKAVAHQPVSVAIEADQKAFQVRHRGSTIRQLHSAQPGLQGPQKTRL